MNASPQRPFPEGALLVAAAVLGGVMVLAGLVLGRQALMNSDDGQALAAGPEAQVTTSTSGPPTTAPPTSGTVPAVPEGDEVEPIACPEGVVDEICDAAEFVQLQRKRPFKTFPEVEMLAGSAFEEALLADFDEYRDEVLADEATLQALGLIEPDASLVELYRDSLSAGVVGFYDPETEQLVVRGEDLDLYAQQVLVHELTHALDDQWFDLDREAEDDEADFGFLAVVEGNASRVDSAWRALLSEADESQLSQDELAALSPEDLATYLALPQVIQELQAAPYTYGATYVDELVAEGGEAAVDETLVEPPTSSEEILNPALDRETDPEIDLAPPPADGEIVDQGRLGQLLIQVWLGRLAADGWGGDEYVTWRDSDGRACITADLIGDSDTDHGDLRAAADAWAATAEGRSVDSITVDAGNVIRVIGCA